MGGIAEATEDIDNFTVTFVPGANERKATDIISGLSSGWYITKKHGTIRISAQQQFPSSAI